jgi:predicted enzyme related to lactoylglutathione lyase
MTSRLQTVIYPVKDLERAKNVYTTLLGSPPAHEAPYYVGWNINGQDIGLDPNGHRRGMTAPLAYWRVEDISTAIERLVAAGATVQQQPRNVGAGKLVASVKDADGNVTGLMQNP